MNKRENKALISVATVLIIISVIAFLVLGFDRRYKVKGSQILAADLDMTSVVQPDSTEVKTDIESIVDYYKSNGINTAILSINNGGESIIDMPGFDYIYADNRDFSEKDIVTQLKKALEKEKIQLYIQVDCEGISDEEIISAAKYIHDNYAVAGFVADNFSGDSGVLRQVKKSLKKGLRKIDFILQTDDISSIDEILAGVDADAVIGENMNVHDYTQLKKQGYKDKQLIFHYESPSMESDIFVLTNFSALDGAVLSSYNDAALPQSLNRIFTKSSRLPTFGFSVPDELTVTYPSQDMATYYDGIFLTGTGATDEVININGADYPAQYDGTFGVYINLVPGENILNISTSDETLTRTVTRKTYSYSGGGGIRTTPWDDTVKLDKGRVVKTINPLTSVLSDPDDDSAIIAGLEPGTFLKVVDSAETKRSGEKTYAYLLSNGGYVLAQNVEITNYITSDYTPPKKNKKQKTNVTATRYELMSQPVISAIVASELDSGDEVMNFTVNSSPAVFSHFGDSALTLHFLDAEISDVQLPQSGFFSGYSVVQQENGVRITMNYSGEKQLWGYDISSEDGIVKLYLKQAPYLSHGDKPLAGVTIMLDAGHGGGDSGALGIAGTDGAVEDMLNLAVAQATQALLKEYGADVVMTRDEDIFLELEERRSLVRSVKPDLFISVHHNSMDYSYDSTTARGSECYYFTSQSKKLADLMCSNISAATNRRDRGEKTGYYYVTRTDIAPSVLMEYSFIINPQDYSTTYSDIDIYRAAWGTVQAILKAIPQ